MRKMFFKSAAMALCLVMALGLFSACTSGATETIEVVKNPLAVTVEADGQQITFEDTEGKTVSELLAEAEITLGDGDLVSVDPEQTFSDSITVRVLRKCAVTVAVTDPVSGETATYTYFSMGGTVADALAGVGLELTGDHVANFAMDAALVDGMEITVTVKEEVTEQTEDETTEATEATEVTTEATTPTPTTPTTPTTPPATTPAPTTPPATSEPTTEPTTAPTTAPTAPERTVVNEEIYYDCDGSGHGVKIITYSDGTQEEVYF